ncbi:hypothetical protein V2J09_022849 [Rumex salicifolius]
MASKAQPEAQEQQQSPRVQIYSTSTDCVSAFWRGLYPLISSLLGLALKDHVPPILEPITVPSQLVDERFFKDRHYLDKEWGHYFTGTGKKVLLEVYDCE